jgi:hypothetical protein
LESNIGPTLGAKVDARNHTYPSALIGNIPSYLHQLTPKGARARRQAGKQFHPENQRRPHISPFGFDTGARSWQTPTLEYMMIEGKPSQCAS